MSHMNDLVELLDEANLSLSYYLTKEKSQIQFAITYKLVKTIEGVLTQYRKNNNAPHE